MRDLVIASVELCTDFKVHSHFRYYILRERPTAGSRSDNIMEDIPMNESGEGALLGLPESETDLDVSFILMPSFAQIFKEFRIILFDNLVSIFHS